MRGAEFFGDAKLASTEPPCKRHARLFFQSLTLSDRDSVDPAAGHAFPISGRCVCRMASTARLSSRRPARVNPLPQLLCCCLARLLARSSQCIGAIRACVVSQPPQLQQRRFLHMQVISSPAWPDHHALTAKANDRLPPVPYPMSLPRSDCPFVRVHPMIIVMHMARPPACAVHGDFRVQHLRVTVVRGDPQL